jgi:hypothetical protein
MYKVMPGQLHGPTAQLWARNYVDSTEPIAEKAYNLVVTKASLAPEVLARFNSAWEQIF